MDWISPPDLLSSVVASDLVKSSHTNCLFSCYISFLAITARRTGTEFKRYAHSEIAMILDTAGSEEKARKIDSPFSLQSPGPFHI